MKYTFKLKAPNSDKETLILFTCSFKDENKKFVYSTGEKINPYSFDFSNKFPFASGKNRAKNFETIKTQLNRYSDLYLETFSLYKRINESFNSQILKKAFDEKFKKTVSGKNVFFDAYDVFTAEKTKGKEWSASTIKRYKNIKNILENFEETKKFKLTFSVNRQQKVD